MSAEKGLYYCFGCGESGDVITFVREIEHLDFVGAVERLAAKAGITLRYTTQQQGEGRKRHGRLVEVMERGGRLVPRAPAHVARRRPRPRLPALAGPRAATTVRQFRIGWAPDGWDALAKALAPSPASVLQSTPGSASSTGGTASRTSSATGCCSRSSTPRATRWRSAGGCMPGGTTGPKYRNTAGDAALPQEPGALRPQLGQGRASSRPTRSIVCEGYTDVIGFATAGHAPGGGHLRHALTEEHVKLLRRFARRVVLAFDADAAGQAAAERVYEWEQAHDIDVAVADLPAGRRSRRPRPARSRARCGPRSSAPGRSWASASTGCWPAPTSARPRVGPGPPRPPWRSSPSTPASSSATST